MSHKIKTEYPTDGEMSDSDEIHVKPISKGRSILKLRVDSGARNNEDDLDDIPLVQRALLRDLIEKSPDRVKLLQMAQLTAPLAQHGSAEVGQPGPVASTQCHTPAVHSQSPGQLDTTIWTARHVCGTRHCHLAVTAQQFDEYARYYIGTNGIPIWARHA